MSSGYGTYWVTFGVAVVAAVCGWLLGRDSALAANRRVRPLFCMYADGEAAGPRSGVMPTPQGLDREGNIVLMDYAANMIVIIVPRGHAVETPIAPRMVGKDEAILLEGTPCECPVARRVNTLQVILCGGETTLFALKPNVVSEYYGGRALTHLKDDPNARNRFDHIASNELCEATNSFAEFIGANGLSSR